MRNWLCRPFQIMAQTPINCRRKEAHSLQFFLQPRFITTALYKIFGVHKFKTLTKRNRLSHPFQIPARSAFNRSSRRKEAHFFQFILQPRFITTALYKIFGAHKFKTLTKQNRLSHPFQIPARTHVNRSSRRKEAHFFQFILQPRFITTAGDESADEIRRPPSRLSQRHAEPYEIFGVHGFNKQNHPSPEASAAALPDSFVS